MDIQLANELFTNGILTKMFNAGFISAKIFTYREYYLFVQDLINSGMKKDAAVMAATIKFNTDRRTIYYALKAFSGATSPLNGN